MRRFGFLSGFLLFALSVSPVLAQSPSLQIISPAEGDTVHGNQVLIKFKADNFTFTDFRGGAVVKPNEGHLHIWLDSGNPVAETALKQISTEPYILDNVPTGSHTVTLELVHSDHTSLSPKVVKNVHFSSVAPQPATTPTEKPGALPPSAQIAIGVAIAIAAILGFAYITLKPKD